MDAWEKADAFIDRVEQILLVILLGLMILIAFLQIALRNLFYTGLSWGDPLVRNLVLWVSFIGATLATREEKHINIDVISRGLPLWGRRFLKLICQLFSFLICSLLTFAALKFIRNEVQMGSLTFLKIPAWVPEIVLPIIFGLMALRFGFQAFKNLHKMMKGNRVGIQGEKL